ncbi:MAG: hypothetical protein IKC09_03815, partial [Oscillospiraceae bacterium]|nr:hypothetical protein [Oscillospiraceae bacterium]
FQADFSIRVLVMPKLQKRVSKTVACLGYSRFSLVCPPGYVTNLMTLTRWVVFSFWWRQQDSNL